jgi:hypothetical protein
MSLGGVTPASLELATLGLLLGCTGAGLCAAAMDGVASGDRDFTCSSQRIEPITAAPARTRSETLNVQVPERRRAAKPVLFGWLE